MKIATFNANSVRSRLDVILAWLRAHQPDLLAIQETKVQDRDFPSAPFRAAGYEIRFRGEKAYNGVALASRRAPDEVRFGLDDPPHDETRVLYARFGALHLLNTYVPQGREIDHEMYRYKLAWFGRLREYLERRFTPRRRVLWVGDMNVAPQPIDVARPERHKRHVCFHEAVREAFARTVDWGFRDVFRQHHPEPGQYTFFDYRFPRAVEKRSGWRIDHILATPPLARRCSDACIDIKPRLGPKPSDHTFLTAEFDID